MASLAAEAALMRRMLLRLPGARHGKFGGLDTAIARGFVYKELRLVPALQARPPAAYVPAVVLVICSKFIAQRWLFIEHDKEVHA